MKRKLNECIRPVAYYPVAAMSTLNILSQKYALPWANLKGDNEEYIALEWLGKLYFRKLYYREYRGTCFKFFNRIIYLDECIVLEY